MTQANPSKTRIMNNDRIVSVVLMVVASILINEGMSLPYDVRGTPGSGFFPIYIGVAMFGLAILLFVISRHQNRPFITSLEAVGRVAKVLATFLIYIVLNSYLGTIIAIAIFIAFVSAVIEKRSWREWVPFAVIVSVAAHLLFKTWLGVPLP